MTRYAKNDDLCSTCNHSDICVRLKTLIRPIWFCEEFDDYIPPLKKISSQDTLKTEDTGCDKLLGLCCNCSNKNRCTLNKPSGGVWHCEEYC